MGLLRLLVAVGFCKSNNEARQKVTEGAVSIGPDRTKMTDPKATVTVEDGLVVRLGSKKIVRVRLAVKCLNSQAKTRRREEDRRAFSLDFLLPAAGASWRDTRIGTTVFVDRVEIFVKAGDGGRGMAASGARSTSPRAGPTAATAATAGRSSSGPWPNADNLAAARPPEALEGQERRAGRPSQCHGKNGEGPGHRRPAGHDRPRPRPRARAQGPDRDRPAGDGRPGRPRRPRQQVLRHLDQPGAPRVRARRRRRGAVDQPGTEGDRRRRPGRPAERRQVHAAVPAVAGPAGDRRLPVHDQVPEPRHRQRRRRPVVRPGRPARPDRRGPQRASGSGTSSSATSSGRGCSSTWSSRSRPTAATRCRTTARSAASWSCTARPWPASRSSSPSASRS